jgi:predicted transcriptional regulator
MESEKGKTFRIMREKREVSQMAKDNLKGFNTIKKEILNALKERDMTIDELTQKLGRPKHDIMYHLMSLVKYGFVQTGAIDDMDEYFSYKIKK